MLKEVVNWIESKSNVFTMYGCEFEVLHSPEESETQSITVDFECENYYCRLIFWDAGYGHVEVVDVNTEETMLDQSFDVVEQLRTAKPFNDFLIKMTS